MSMFLETVMREYNLMRARSFAGDYTGVTHAGLALVNDGEVFLAQRAMDETDNPAVQQTWEFPGGSLDPGEQPFEAALREFLEETGLTMPSDATVTNGWRSDDGVYQCFVMDCAGADMTEWHLADWQPTSECQAVGWFTRETMPENLRPEVRDGTPWDLIFGAVSGNEEMDMTSTAPEMENPAEDASEPMEEPDHSDMSGIMPDHIMVHGVLAPEAAPSGDSRGFTAGAVTSRPLRLPLGWQEKVASGHDGAVTVGSIDRMARKDNLIYWEGALMCGAEETDEFVGLLLFFGQYGLSIDGVKGSVDEQQSKADGMLWFDAVQVAGATACAVPAFAEAYVALGPSPDMPADNAPDTLAASGFGADDIVGIRREEFSRGPGWATDPKATNRIHDYWTKPGQPGYEKVGWGKPGDFARAKALIGEKIAKHSPGKMRFLNQIIAQWHHDALGYWPATHAKMVRDGVSASVEGTETVQATDGIQPDEDGEGWEAVLVSSAGARALPPSSYFDRHPDTDALVIEEPDEFGLIRTYGYAGEWGVCHIGYDGRCVELPRDPDGGEFNHFHLGRTKTSDEGYIKTGVITYKVDHLDAEAILTESAEKQHFDNLKHAWAAVRLGEDENGTWFSGVVLPGIPAEDLVLIEATGQVSGTWKHNAMRGLQAVNIPGFPVLRSSAAYDDEGNVIALVASSFHDQITVEANGTEGSPCAQPTPAERMQALAAIDAEVRFAALREQYLAEQSALSGEAV